MTSNVDHEDQNAATSDSTEPNGSNGSSGQVKISHIATIRTPRKRVISKHFLFVVGGLKRPKEVVKKPPEPVAKAAKRIARSKPVVLPVLQSDHNPVDHGEAKDTNAPSYCDLCKMKFASQAKFNTHVMYSLFHELNSKQPLLANNQPPDDPKALGEVPKLLFRASKYIIKHNMMLDCCVYLSNATPAHDYKRLALICYCMDLEVEYPPIYLNGTAIEERCRRQSDADSVPNEVHLIVKHEESDPTHLSRRMGEWVVKRVTWSAGLGVQLDRLNASDCEPIPIVQGPVVAINNAEFFGYQQRKKSVDYHGEFLTQLQQLEADKLVDKRSIQLASTFAEKARLTIDAYTRRFSDANAKSSFKAAMGSLSRSFHGSPKHPTTSLSSNRHHSTGNSSLPSASSPIGQAKVGQKTFKLDRIRLKDSIDSSKRSDGPTLVDTMEGNAVLIE